MDIAKNAAKSAFAGLTAALITQPWEVIITQVQISRQKPLPAARRIRQSQGWRGFFAGLRFNFATMPIFFGLYFPAYQYLKDQNISSAPAGVAASLMGSFIVNPFYVMKVREQNQLVYKSNTSALDILRREGPRAFYKGYGLTMLKSADYAITMPLYETLKQYVPTPIATAIAKAAAITITYPLEILRLRVRNQTHQPTEIIKKITAQRAWYNGYATYLTKSASRAVIIFWIYELLQFSKC